MENLSKFITFVQEVNTDEVNNEIIIHLYSDGSSEKKYVSKLTD